MKIRDSLGTIDCNSIKVVDISNDLHEKVIYEGPANEYDGDLDLHIDNMYATDFVIVMEVSE